jgi:hypothetical protein
MLELPPYEAEKLESVLDQVEDAMANCRRGGMQTVDVKMLLDLLWSRALDAVASGTPAWHMLRARKKTSWWSLGAYPEDSDCSNLTVLKNAVAMILDNLALGARPPRYQVYFSPGDHYAAMRRALAFMRLAERELIIVDQFLDDVVFNYIDALDENLQLKLLTGQRKRMFPVLIRAVASQRGHIEARLNENCHDRFLVLDEGRVVHLGTSLNSLGTQAFMMHDIVDESARVQFLKDCAAWLANGEPIT